MLSIVIITYNNYSLKHGCIELVINSLLAQTNVLFEVIIVDNCSDATEINRLDQYVYQNCKDKCVTLIRHHYNNISAGRNLGIKKSSGDTILFMDDDVLLPNSNILNKIVEISQNNCYGYSAVRKWTSPDWYKTLQLDDFQTDDICKKIAVHDPDPQVRKKKNNRHLSRTYIGNFGFISRSTIEKVGHWNECYTGYGLEDDEMALKLYLNCGRPALLSNIDVYHIWHEISSQNYQQLNNNQAIFNQLLRSRGIKSFHVGRLLYCEEGVIDYY